MLILDQSLQEKVLGMSGTLDQLFSGGVMHINHFFRKTASIMLTASLLVTQVLPVHAGMISTGQVLAAQGGQLDRSRLVSFLEREDLQRQLAAMGVDVQNAKERVAGLTDAEVAQINQRLDELPAGGDILGVILAIFIIFIITDALGVTDIFPFVHPIK
jgi:hypothetical protein